MVHIGLEGGWGVAESEEHDSWLVEPEGGGEGGFLAVFQLDEDVIVSPANIEFCEDFAILEFIH